MNAMHATRDQDKDQDALDCDGKAQVAVLKELWVQPIDAAAQISGSRGPAM
jgi:hypothetical protein